MDISINFSKDQFITDVKAECNLLARTMNATREDNTTEGNSIPSELASYLKEPMDDVTKIVLARAITKGIDSVKLICSRFMIYGRKIDNNNIEKAEGDWVLNLRMSDTFNIAVTSTIKSYIHDYIVNMAMAHILRAQLPAVATNYQATTAEDEQLIKRAINARDRFSRSHNGWGNEGIPTELE